MKTKTEFTNLQIAKMFRSIAAALSLSSGDNRFRTIAYDRAADAIEHSSSEIRNLWQEGELGSLSGIGESMQAHLDELFKTGKVAHFEKVLAPFPEAIFDLMDVPGIGPKNALKLCKAFGISKSHSAISKLEKAARDGKIAQLEGFGEESQAKILKGIEQYKNSSSRMLQDSAHALIDGVIDWMKDMPQVKEINYLGSLRRQAATIGDLDMAIATDHPVEVIERFTKYPKAKRVIEAGSHSSSILLPGEIQVDLMVQPPAQYGSLLQHFTGSKHHNIALREYALKKGLSLSEYGIRKINPDDSVKPSDDKNLHSFATEKAFYNFLDLDWVPPELREGRGEIEAAKNHTLPGLVELADIKGDMHMHSNIDIETSHDLGRSTIEELVKKAQSLGYEYIGITEHNPSVSGHNEKQTIEIIQKKVDFLASKKLDFQVFNGMEIDIQPTGARALPDKALELLDYGIVSLHSSFAQGRDMTTKRVLSALDHPKVKFLGHPTGRLLNERDGVDMDWDQIFDFCLKHDKWIEINAWPNRLDLPDVLVHEAVKIGVKIIINSDSHVASDMDLMKYGISVARRGWAQPKNIVNTLGLKEFRQQILHHDK